MANDLTCVKMVLRSLLLSYKDGCRLHSLPGAYRELDGNFIPFRELGYSSLQQFIQHIPDVARMSKNRDGEDIVVAIANEQTAHIQKMVQRQKSKKSKSKPRPRYRGRPSRPPPPQRKHYNNSRPPPFSGYSVPKPQHPVKTPLLQQPPSGAHITSAAKAAAQRALQPSSRPVNQPNRASSVAVNLPPRLQKKAPQTQNRIVVNRDRDEFQIALSQMPSPGETITVRVSHIQDPHNVFVTKTTNVINNIMTRIQARMVTDYLSLAEPTSPQDMIGAFCLARYSKDDHWYRAYIIDANVSARFKPVYQVQFVDFGNSEKRTLSDIQPILAGECVSEAQCLRLSLSGILPKEMSWTNEVNMMLQSLVENVPVNMKLSRIINEEICEAFLETSEGLNVNEYLLDQGLARRKNQEPPKLVPPKDDFPMVYVSYFESTTDVVVRYMGEEYSEMLAIMEDAMLDTYRNTEYRADKFMVNVGGVYAALCSDEAGTESACRVRVLKCRDTRVGRVVDCYLPDHGDTETIDVTRLRWLAEQFRSLPYQAVTVSLAGLESFRDNKDVLQCMVDELLGEEFDAEFDPDDPRHQNVILYDPNTNDNMNEHLLKKIPDKDLTHTLPEPDSRYGSDAITVKVLSIRDGDGVISVRIPGEGERRYTELERQLQVEMAGMGERRRAVVGRGERVVALYVDDDGSHCWYRAKVLDVQLSTVLVEYVDYGNTSTLASTDVCTYTQLGASQHQLANLPIQRKDVRLTGLPPGGGEWTEAALEELGSILHPDKKFQLTVDRMLETGLAEVTLYGYSDDQEQLVCINDYFNDDDVIGLFVPKDPEPEVAPAVPEVPERRSRAGRERINTPSPAPSPVPSPAPSSVDVLDASADQDKELQRLATLHMKYYHARPLPRTVDIAEPHTFMAVYIPWAEDPTNFVCIPMESFDDLSMILERMNEHYARVPHVAIKLVEGQLYAAMYQGQWYRVIVQKVFPDLDKVAGHFVDFGDYHTLSVGEVQPLDGSFHTIPRMSFRARLGGVGAGGTCWEQDARRWFQDLVVARNVHCLVLDKPADLEQAGAAVTVDLVVPCGHEQIPVASTLIQKGLARPAPLP